MDKLGSKMAVCPSLLGRRPASAESVRAKTVKLKKESYESRQPANLPQTKPHGVGLARLQRMAPLFHGLMAVGCLGMAAQSVSVAVRAPTSVLLEDDHNLTAEQRQLLEQELDRFDSRELGFIAQGGARIHVTESDEELLKMAEEAGSLRQLPLQEAVSEATRMRTAGDKLIADAEFQAYNTKLARIQQDLAGATRAWSEANGFMGMRGLGGFGGFGLGPGGGGAGTGGGQELCAPDPTPAPPAVRSQNFTPPSEEMMELQKSLGETQEERARMLKWGLIEAGVLPDQATSQFGSSVQMMTARAGAQTDAEKAEYRELLEAANGERLVQARQQALTRQQIMVESLPEGPWKENAQAFLDQLEQNPDQLILDLSSFAIFSPRVKYVHMSEGGQSFRVHPESNLDTVLNHSAGVHFGSNGAIQVDHDQVTGTSGTTSHEVGHSLQRMLQMYRPEFAKTWNPKLEKAFQAATETARCGGRVNSQYGLTNSSEYFAEGVEAYREDAEALQEVDPALHTLVEDALAEARSQSFISQFNDVFRPGALGVLTLCFAMMGRQAAARNRAADKG